METHTALLTLISMAVLVGLGVGYLAKTAMFKNGPIERGPLGQMKAGGLFDFGAGTKVSSQRKPPYQPKISQDETIKARLEKTFTDSASGMDD